MGSVMRIAIGSDHNGFTIKNSILIPWLQSQGHQVVDSGAFEFNAEDDYPDFAKKVALKISTQQAERGIIICGSGVGASITANKINGIRAAICHDTYSAKQGVQHDDMNVICIGSKIVGEQIIYDIIESFLSAQFQDSEERFVRRLNKVLDVEQQKL
jgi:ribose 5-phosphate isomerase B